MNSNAVPTPRAIAPATAALGSNTPEAANTMPYTCVTCARRKLRCDKTAPTCTTCRKGRLECTYQAPAPRRKKRRLSGDDGARLAKYEKILRDNDLLPQEDYDPEASTQESLSFRFFDSGTSKAGKVVSQHGTLRYLNGMVWHHLGDEDLQQLAKEDGDEDGITENIASDPLTAAFLGSYMDLSDHYPTPVQCMLLWDTHVGNVEPICKILHIPTTSQMVLQKSQYPGLASPQEECLLFAIFRFAIFSMAEEECIQKLQEPKAVLLERYEFATRQALVNASFLKSSTSS